MLALSELHEEFQMSIFFIPTSCMNCVSFCSFHYLIISVLIQWAATYNLSLLLKSCVHFPSLNIIQVLKKPFSRHPQATSVPAASHGARGPPFGGTAFSGNADA